MGKAINKILILIILTFVLASPVTAVAPTINTYNLTPDIGGDGHYYPDIYGNKVVWEDYRNNTTDIYMADITDPENPTEYVVAGNEGFSENNPKIYQNYVVWTDSRNGDSDIYMADITDPDDPKEYPVSVIPGSQQTGPVIYGNTIVWTDSRNGDSDIYMADITDPENPVEYPVIILAGSSQQEPQIYNNNIIWSDGRSGNCDIYMADVSNPEVPLISTISAVDGFQCPSAISNNYIAWEDDRDSYDKKIYYYDLASETEKIVDTTGISLAVDQLDISAGRIVWVNYEESDNSTVYCYDIQSNDIFEVAVADTSKYAIAMDDNRVAWEDYGPNWSENADIIFATFTYPEVEDNLPPTFSSIPGDTKVVNLTEGELITTNPYIIKVNPDDDTAIEKVEFYVDGVLICNDTIPDDDGVYSCAWDTSKYHSDIRIVAHDTSGNTTELLRSVTVDPLLYTLPQTGMSVRDYWNLFIGNFKKLFSSF